MTDNEFEIISDKLFDLLNVLRNYRSSIDVDTKMWLTVHNWISNVASWHTYAKNKEDAHDWNTLMVTANFLYRKFK